MLKLSRYLKKYRKETILGPFFKFLEAVFELLLPTVMALIINNGVNKQDSDYVIRMGLLMVVGSALLMDESTPFPGTAALVPVLGAALLVGAGTRVPD